MKYVTLEESGWPGAAGDSRVNGQSSVPRRERAAPAIRIRRILHTMQADYDKRGSKRPRLQHTSLPISDGAQDAIRAFYGGLLGLTEKPLPHVFAGRGLVWFAAGDGEMELHFVPDTYLSHLQEGRHICIEVEDVESYRSKLQELDYPIIEADPIPHRPRFFTLDPCGNRLELTTILGDYLQTEEEES